MRARFALLSAIVAAAVGLGAPVSSAEPGAPVALPTTAGQVDPGEVYEPGRRPRSGGAVVASVEAEQIARWNVGGSGDPGLPSNRRSFHPAPRVHVSLDDATPLRLPEKARGKRGVLSRVAVLAQARNLGYWPFRICYEEGLRRLPRLFGTSELRLSVARDGRVTKSAVVNTELQQSDVSQCLVEKAHRLRFSPAPPKSFVLRLVIDLHPGDAPIPDAISSERLEPQQSESPAVARLRVGDALAALAPARERVAECYSRAVIADAKLWGRLALLLDVDAKGGVTSATQFESRFPAAGVVACAIEAARTAKFGTALGGGAGMRLIWALKLGVPATPAVTPAPEAASLDAGAGSRDP